MNGVLEDCDTCLSEKAREQDGRLIFGSTNVTIAWAALAKDYSLRKLLFEFETFMLAC